MYQNANSVLTGKLAWSMQVIDVETKKREEYVQDILENLQYKVLANTDLITKLFLWLLGYRQL